MDAPIQSNPKKPFAVFSRPPIQTKEPAVNYALRLSVWDGAFFCAMQALIDTFAVAGAVKLHAPAIAIGILAGLPLLLGSLGQLCIAYFVRLTAGRKRYVLMGTGGQAAFLVLLSLSGLFPENIRAWSYVLLFALQGFGGNVIAGLWMAWMNDLVDPKERGRYFAWRNRIINFATLGCGLTAGALAFGQTVQTGSWSFFLAVFLCAGFFRIISTFILSRQYEPPPQPVPGPAPSGHAPENTAFKGFLFYSIALALMQGSVMLASPFFNVWFVRDLHFNYFTLAASTASMVLGSIITLPFWGRLSDRMGHRRVLLLTGFMITLVPLPFTLTGVPWIILIFNFYSGFCWSGYNLSNFNYLLVLSNSRNPERSLSFAMAISGIAIFLFSLLGGYLATRLPRILDWQLQSLFLLSSVLRLIVFAAFFLNLPRCEPGTSRIRDNFYQLARRLMDKVLE